MHPNIIRLLEVCNSSVKETEANFNLKQSLVQRPLNDLINLPAPQPINLQQMEFESRKMVEEPDRFVEYMIFEFAEHELGSLLQKKMKFEEKHIKCMVK